MIRSPSFTYVGIRRINRRSIEKPAPKRSARPQRCVYLMPHQSLDGPGVDAAARQCVAGAVPQRIVAEYRLGTATRPRRSFAMRKFYPFYGIAALVGALILFMSWLAGLEKQAGMDRLERLETLHTLGAH